MLHVLLCVRRRFQLHRAAEEEKVEPKNTKGKQNVFKEKLGTSLLSFVPFSTAAGALFFPFRTESCTERGMMTSIAINVVQPSSSGFQSS